MKKRSKIIIIVLVVVTVVTLLVVFARYILFGLVIGYLSLITKKPELEDKSNIKEVPVFEAISYTTFYNRQLFYDYFKYDYNEKEHYDDFDFSQEEIPIYYYIPNEYENDENIVLKIHIANPYNFRIISAEIEQEDADGNCENYLEDYTIYKNPPQSDITEIKCPKKTSKYIKYSVKSIRYVTKATVKPSTFLTPGGFFKYDEKDVKEMDLSKGNKSIIIKQLPVVTISNFHKTGNSVLFDMYLDIGAIEDYNLIAYLDLGYNPNEIISITSNELEFNDINVYRKEAFVKNNLVIQLKCVIFNKEYTIDLTIIDADSESEEEDDLT